MTDEPRAQLATFANAGLTKDGRHAVLGFKRANGDDLVLALPVEQIPALIAAGGALGAQAQQQLGEAAPPPATFQVERWGIEHKEKDLKVLNFRMVGGMALRLEVTAATVREDDAAP